MNELKIAVGAAVKAGEIILKYYQSDYEIKDKGFQNPVTTADHASDKILKEILINAYPDYGWLSEETLDSKSRLQKKKVWVVDPLDGTKEFIEGVPHFVVSIALVDTGRPILGGLHNPVTKEIFTAYKGMGAKLNDKLIKCNVKKYTNQMVILNSRSETDKGLWNKYQDQFARFKAVGSVAYKLGLTAAGEGDVFASLRPKNEWDICAGNCIINEAGGKLIDLNGNQRVYNLNDTLIQPGSIAGENKAVDQILSMLRT